MLHAKRQVGIEQGAGCDRSFDNREIKLSDAHRFVP